MATELRVIGWRCEGFRSPDHAVDLTNGEGKVHGVTLVQMPNGTGKTTTLSLLRAALSGAARDWTDDEIADFQDPQRKKPKGLFLVFLLVNDRRLTFELSLDFLNRKIRYRTTHGGNIQEGFVPPNELRRVFSPEFVELYVFDGELANRLLNSEHTKAQEALDAQFQLSLLNQLSAAFGKNWEEHANRVSAKEERGLSRRKNRLASLQARLADVKKEHKELVDRKVHLEERFRRAQQTYEEALLKDEEIGSNLEGIIKELHQAELSKEKLSLEVLDELRSPHLLVPCVATHLQELKANLDALKLPASTSREFFEELCEADACICGTNMTSEMRTTIRERAGNYLGGDDVGVLNSIKAGIAELVVSSADDYRLSLDRQLTRLGEAVDAYKRLEDEKAALEEQRIRKGDSELDDKKDERDRAKSELDAVSGRLDELESEPDENDGDDTESIKSLVRKVKEAEADYAEITETVELRDKTELIQSIISRATERARSRLSEDLLAATNEKIARMLKRTPVRVRAVDESVHLESQRGASVGQTLAVGYAFLASLFEMGHFRLPFVVDSPVGSLDNRVRREVAKLMPIFTPQLVAFLISSERPDFVSQLEAIGKQEIQYLTLFRKEANAAFQVAEPHAVLSESENGYLVVGREFFERFDTGDSDEEQPESRLELN